MSILSKFLFGLAFLFTIYHLPFTAGSAFAENEFTTDYKVSYFVDSSGKTDVTQNITLKNKTATYYADRFELKIGSTKVDNVKASDPQGAMETQVAFNDNTTTISVKFNQKVIGIDKTLAFNLSYTSNELATRAGQIWEISIPRLANSSEIGSYSATLSVPTIFGKVAFSVPNPRSSLVKNQLSEFTFDKEQLMQSGISMSFGERQVFSFKLDYYLENNNLTSQIQEIALPPDNNYQKIILESLEPVPLDVVVDPDGNFLARYRLPPKTKKEITAKGYVEVFSKPTRKLIDTLSSQERSKYTQPQRYWEVDNSSIKEKAQELDTPRKIYDFVASYLTYSQERLNQPKIERKGAVSAFNSPKDSVCTEFSDLFIAIARAAQIPAREVEGYAFSQNERLRPLSLALEGKDVLHAWPEFWDEELGWVQVDPTWASTSGGLDYFDKLDFNHITFVQRGSSSTWPYPAGSYKSDTEIEKKDVYVEFAQELPSSITKPELELKSPQKLISGIPSKISARLKNEGNVSIINQKLILKTTKLKIGSDRSDPYVSEVLITVLPPYASRDFDFKLLSDNLFRGEKDDLLLTFADVQILKPILILPIYKIPLSTGFLISIILAILIVGAGLYFYRHKKVHHFEKDPS